MYNTVAGTEKANIVIFLSFILFLFFIYFSTFLKNGYCKYSVTIAILFMASRPAADTVRFYLLLLGCIFFLADSIRLLEEIVCIFV
jgi:cellulose synthase/poly-beta-1,6-N-acetylglucosamine synthase-like glycosyltransferase